MSRKERIKKLETELRILRSEIYQISNKDGYSYHSRYNKFVRRYHEILKELERISLKWKIKKLLKKEI